MERIKFLKDNILYDKTLNIIYNHIGIEKFNIIDNGENLIAFSFKTNESYSFEIVFWLNENRISFNIEDWYEILDSYLTSEQEAFEDYEFIDTIFRNDLYIEEYGIGNSKKIFKKNLIFTTKIKNEIQKIENKKILRFKLPWIIPNLISSKKYKALY